MFKKIEIKKIIFELENKVEKLFDEYNKNDVNDQAWIFTKEAKKAMSVINAIEEICMNLQNSIKLLEDIWNS